MGQPANGTPGKFGYSDQGQLITGNNGTNFILAFILGALQGILAAGGGGGGGGGTPVTPTFVSLGASASQDIPIGAKGWTVTFLTGTGTVGGSAVPAGFSDSDGNTLAAAITVTTDAASTAYIRWNT